MDLILHLGAHRTGSTAVVRMVQANEAALQAEGLALWPPDALRAMPAFPALHVLAPRARAGGATARRRMAGLRRIFATEMAELAALGFGRLLLSEENVIGGMQNNLATQTLYPDLASRVGDFAEVLPQRPVRIGIGLRNYATVWTSSYAYMLPRRPLPRFDSLAAGLAAGTRGWPEVAAEVRQAFPEAEIVLWRQERLAGALPAVVAALVGRAHHADLAGIGSRINAARMAGATDLFHLLRARDPGLSGEALAERVETLIGTVPSSAPAFPAQAEAELTARYWRDMDRLAQMPGVRFIDGA